MRSAFVILIWITLAFALVSVISNYNLGLMVSAENVTEHEEGPNEYKDYLTAHFNNTLAQTSPIKSNLQVATFDGWYVYQCWVQQDSGTTGIYCVSSQDGGRTYSKPLNLSHRTGNATNPHVGAFADEVYVTWEANTPGLNHNVFLAKSINAGLNFSKPMNVSNTKEDVFDSVLDVNDSGKVIISWLVKSHPLGVPDDAVKTLTIMEH